MTDVEYNDKDVIENKLLAAIFGPSDSVAVVLSQKELKTLIEILQNVSSEMSDDYQQFSRRMSEDLQTLHRNAYE